jgi:chromosome segregation ATPase
LAALEETCNDGKMLKSDLTERLGEMSRELQRKNEYIHDTTIKSDMMQQQLSTLQAELQSLKSRNEELHQTIDQHVVEAEHLKSSHISEIDAIKQSLAKQHETSILKINMEKNELVNQISNLNAQNNKLQEDMRVMAEKTNAVDNAEKILEDYKIRAQKALKQVAF